MVWIQKNILFKYTLYSLYTIFLSGDLALFGEKFVPLWIFWYTFVDLNEFRYRFNYKSLVTVSSHIHDQNIVVCGQNVQSKVKLKEFHNFSGEVYPQSTIIYKYIYIYRRRASSTINIRVLPNILNWVFEQ